MYVDGKSQGINTFGTSFTSETLFSAEVAVYHYFGSPIQYFNGTMDELVVWNKALTQTEIQQNMCEKLIGTEVGLVAYYSMNEGTDNTALEEKIFAIRVVMEIME